MRAEAERFGLRTRSPPNPMSAKESGEMKIVPMTLKEANRVVLEWHRHHKPVVGARFSIGLSDGQSIRGVAIVGRPVARMADDGWTVEVTRCCTDGIPNGCSKLYRAAWRAAKAMGFKRLITYTLPDEGGASLRGAGFRLVGEAGGGKWSRKTRPRLDDHPTQQKHKWELL